MTDIKSTKGIYLVRTFLEDVFSYEEHQEDATYGLGYKLTLQRLSDDQVLSHVAATNAANLALAGSLFINDISWFVPQYTPNISQKLILEYIVSRAATQLTYIKGSSYSKDVTTENYWIFELGVQSGIDVPIFCNNRIYAKRSI